MESNPKLLALINDAFKMIGTHPQMFAGRVECIESFVAGMEFVLSNLDEVDYHRFRDFQSGYKFPEETFTVAFERQNECRLAFVPRSEYDRLGLEENHSIFAELFEAVWKEYLEGMKSDTQFEHIYSR